MRQFAIWGLVGSAIVSVTVSDTVARGDEGEAGGPWGMAYLVSSRTEGIFRIDDKNGDGDALDTGENLLWADGFAGLIELETVGASVYAIDEGPANGAGIVVRLQDLNGDGDALDIGERIPWAEGIFDPRGIAAREDGALFVADITRDNILRFSDNNYDGDALDIGESTLYAGNINGATTIMSHDGQLTVTAFNGDAIHRLVDLNGDLDALDVGENLTIVPTVDQPLGLIADGQGGFYFSSRTADTVYHAQDHNSDGDFLDLAEVLSYADFVYGGINGSWDMTPFAGGGFLLANYLQDQILHVLDRNGDGDALDLGDVRLFADGLNLPVDIVPLITLPGDYNGNGQVDSADYTLWRDNLNSSLVLPNDTTPGSVSQEDYDVWKNNFGASAAGSAIANVPEPASRLLILLVMAGTCASKPRRGKNRWLAPGNGESGGWRRF